MNTSQPPPEFLKLLGSLGVDLTDQKIQQLQAYLSFIHETNKRMNLTAVQDRNEMWIRHLLDSLTLVPFLQETGNVMDVGSGAGLPGIPLAIAEPNLLFVLVESTKKKAAFLKRAVEELGLSNVQVVEERAEVIGHDPTHREKYDVATGRALGRLPVFLELTAPFVRVGGKVLAMKGRNVSDEIEDSSYALTQLRLVRPTLYPALPEKNYPACIVSCVKSKKTPLRYPRSSGTPKKIPLLCK